MVQRVCFRCGEVITGEVYVTRSGDMHGKCMMESLQYPGGRRGGLGEWFKTVFQGKHKGGEGK